VQDDHRRTLERATDTTVVGTEFSDIARVEIIAIAHLLLLTLTGIS
jgi:hypothetical protein